MGAGGCGGGSFRGCGGSSFSSCASIESADDRVALLKATATKAAPSQFWHHRNDDDGFDDVRGPLVKAVRGFRPADDNAPAVEGEEGRRRAKKLHEAARAGQLKRAVEAISEGASVQAVTLRGQSALMLAAGSTSQGAIETVRFLIESASDIDTRDNLGWTALHHACRNNQHESMKLLLDGKASLKARTADGKTAVMLSVMDGASDLAVYLVDSKATVNAVDDGQWSALLYACEAGSADLVRSLLKKQANTKDKARDGMTALMVAAERGDTEIGDVLAKKGANLNSRNMAGDTAMLVGIKANQIHFAEWLVEQGADIQLKNKDGEDAGILAEAMGAGTLKTMLDHKNRKHQELEQA